MTPGSGSGTPGPGWGEVAPRAARCRVVRSTPQLIPNGVLTAISFTAEDGHGTDSMWASGAPTQVVIPWDDWWTLDANAGFDNNSTSYRIASIAVNGARVAEDLTAAVNGAPTQLSCGTSMWLAAGTIVTLLVWQTSGFAINATPSEVPISLSVVAA